MIAQRRWRHFVLVFGSRSHFDELGVRACSDNGAGLIVHDLPDGRRREGQRASHLARIAFDLYPVSIFRRALVRDVDIGADARLHPVVPSSDGHAANPVNQGGGDGAMNAAVGIDVVLRQEKAGADNAFRRVGQLNVLEQKLIDGTVRFPALPELLDVRKGLGVVGRQFRGHDDRHEASALEEAVGRRGGVHSGRARRGGVSGMENEVCSLTPFPDRRPAGRSSAPTRLPPRSALKRPLPQMS